MLQFEDSIVIGNSDNILARKCDVLYEAGSNFVDTFALACETAKRKGVNTIKILSGNYVCDNPFSITDEIKVVGDGMPYIYLSPNYSTLSFETNLISLKSQNITIEGVHIGKGYGGSGWSLSIEKENIKLNDIVSDGAIHIYSGNATIIYSKVLSIIEGGYQTSNCIISKNITSEITLSENLNVISGNIINGVPQSSGGGGEIPTEIPCSSLEGVIYVEDTNLISGNYTVGGMDASGNITTSSGWVIWDDIITVPKSETGEKVNIYRYNNTGASMIAQYDANGNFLRRASLVAGGANSYAIPLDVVTIRLVEQDTNLPNGQTYSWTEVTQFIPYGAKAGYNFDGNPMYADLKEQIEDLPTKDYIIEQVNRLNGTDFSLYDAEYRSGYLNTAGDLKSLASYRCTEPVFVKAGLKIKYKLEHATVAPIIALYSEDTISSSKKVDLVNGIVGVSEGEYIVPSDGYICFVTLASYTDGYVIFDDSIFDAIKDYVKDKVKNANNLSLNILCLGDSIFGNDGEIVSYLAQFTGSNVVNGAIGGTRVSIRSGTDAFQYLDGKNLVQALTSGNWTNQDSAVTTLQGTYTWLPSRIANLKALDMSKVDLVTMDWGTNDYTGGQTIETILSAYDYIIDTLQSAYPELRILITTPIWRYFDDSENGDNKKYADATLKEIAEAIETFAKEKRISVLNAYQNMPLSYNTATTYFDAGDKTHLNKKGNEVYAHLLNGKIRSLY